MGINIGNNYPTSYGNKNKSNKNLIVTKNGETYQKAGALRTTGAVAAAAGGFSAFYALSNAATKKYLNEVVLKNNLEIPQDLYEKILKAAKLDNKVTIPSNLKYLYNIHKAECTVQKWLNNYPKLKEKLIDLKLVGLKEAAEGRNAFFNPHTNAILINPKGKMQFGIFHEVGHALNLNSSTLGKILQKSRTPFIAVLGGLAMFTALFKRKKAEGEKPEGTFDKATTFVKNNCGKIAFLGMTPILIEEAMATFKGEKLAKQLLSPDKLKELKTLNRKAYVTYAAGALALGAGTWLLSFIRDKIAAPKKIESNA